MLAVLQTATSQQDGQVGVVVRVRVAHVAAKENHRVVEQTCFSFPLLGEILQKHLQQSHLSAVGFLELPHLVRGLAVMTQVVLTGR